MKKYTLGISLIVLGILSFFIEWDATFGLVCLFIGGGVLLAKKAR